MADEEGIAAVAPRANAGVTWDWEGAVLGAVYGLPAFALALGDVPRGVAAAVGVIPAAALGLLPVRATRVRIAVVGLVAAVSLVVGGVLAANPPLAVLGIVGLATAAAKLCERRPVGLLVMTLAVPLVGIGLSFDDVGSASAAGVVMFAGSLWATAVSLLWPERQAPATNGPPRTPAHMVGYGLRLGLAGGTAAAIGFALDWEHVGWATAAALLVMRPTSTELRLRSTGRTASVLLGALAGTTLVATTDAPTVWALAVLVAVAAAVATHGSRWYVLPGFTTFLVLSMLTYQHPDQAPDRLFERVGETVLGVGLALLFGEVVPAVLRRADERP